MRTCQTCSVFVFLKKTVNKLRKKIKCTLSWVSLWSSRWRRCEAMFLATASSSSGCTSLASNHCRSSTFSWLWVTWEMRRDSKSRHNVNEHSCCEACLHVDEAQQDTNGFSLKAVAFESSRHTKSGTSCICAAMAAFVSKSSVWILLMYSSFCSHWKSKCKQI